MSDNQSLFQAEIEKFISKDEVLETHVFIRVLNGCVVEAKCNDANAKIIVIDEDALGREFEIAVFEYPETQV